MQNWIIEETKSADFGDKRLNKRYGDLLDSFVNAPSASIPGACKSWTETIAAYRFMNHKNVTSPGILAPHKDATLERIKKEKIVLIPEDSSEIDFTGRKTLLDMGHLTTETSKGFYLHPSLAITPDGCCLGVINAQMWNRTEFGKSKKRAQKPIEEKETYCWIKGYEAANAIALAAPDTIVISIADREGDVYELLEKSHSSENKAYWLVRSQHNRSVLNELTEKFELQLRETVANTESLGEVEFKLTEGMRYRNSKKRVLRTERMVRQEVRSCAVVLRPPQRKDKKLKPIQINVIHCKEINPPENEEAVEWFLLTNYPVKDAEGALEIVQWYLRRWLIEIFFKILKSGCAVEELQFDTFNSTSNCITFYLIVAWRILYLTMLGRSCPDMDCSAVFETNEWHSLYVTVTKKSPPKIPPKLSEIILMIAKLGGFLGRKSDGYPGPKVMWIGIQRMRDFTLAWEAFHSMEKDSSYV